MIKYEVTVDSGTTKWYLNGELHRTDGPAIECFDGGKEWYFKGKRHREDGPAVERVNGGRAWYLNGDLHREDGPAVESTYGYRAWYLNGEKLTEEEFNERTQKVVEMTLEEICEALGKNVKIIRG